MDKLFLSRSDKNGLQAHVSPLMDAGKCDWGFMYSTGTMHLHKRDISRPRSKPNQMSQTQSKTSNIIAAVGLLLLIYNIPDGTNPPLFHSSSAKLCIHFAPACSVLVIGAYEPHTTHIIGHGTGAQHKADGACIPWIGIIPSSSSSSPPTVSPVASSCIRHSSHGRPLPPRWRNHLSVYLTPVPQESAPNKNEYRQRISPHMDTIIIAGLHTTKDSVSTRYRSPKYPDYLLLP